MDAAHHPRVDLAPRIGWLIMTDPFPRYRVDLEQFRGPLDLLLFLIQRDEIDIHDIPIARITTQYMEYLELMRSLDLEVAGDFILMASTLMAIKSRTLLPTAKGVDGEDIEDPRAALVEQLQEYQRVRLASEELGKREETRREVFSRGTGAVLPDAPEGEFEVGLFELLAAYRDALRRAEIRASANPQIELEEVRLEDKIVELRDRLSASAKIRLSDLMHPETTRLEIIVVFIALLELVRLGEISARQPVAFSEIYLYRRGHEDD